MMLSRQKTTRVIVLASFAVGCFALWGFDILHEHGITGATRKNGFGCLCHSITSADSVRVWIEGPESIRVSQIVRYTMIISGGPAVVGGLDVAVNHGTLSPADSTTQVISGEITHTSPKEFHLDTLRWEFFYQSSSTAETDTIYSAGNSCNGDGLPKGDAWNFGANFPVVVSSDTTSGVEDRPSLSRYNLLQNYPNPFNPQTKIGLNLSRESNSTLTVYDLNGRKMDVLFDGILAPGYHQFSWDGSNAPTGIYFYSFRTEKRTETRKMLLIR